MDRVTRATATRRGERRRGKRRAPLTSVRRWSRHALHILWAPPPPAPPAARRERLATLARHHLLPLLLYGLITLVMTYPLVRHPGTHLPGNGFDGWQNLWNFWWLRTALSEGRNPFWMPLLYAPYGAPLYLHALSPFSGVATLPVQLAFGVTAAYNMVVVLSFVLAAYFAYLLVAFVGGSRTAGFIGGIIYGFGSYHLGHFFFGQSNLLATEWLPAYILCLLAMAVAVGRRRTLLVVAGAVALVLLMLCDWEYVVFAIIFTLLYAPYAAAARRSIAPLAAAAATGLLWILLALPLLAPTIAEVRSGATTLATDAFVTRFSADVLSLMLPGARQAWWRAVVARAGLPDIASAYDRAASLGWAPLALAAVGVWGGRRRAGFWLVTAIVFGLLALGPTLQVAGVAHFGEGRWTLPLPYRLLRLLPGVNVSRIPSRFALVTTLCLAVLAGLGLAALARRWPALGRPPLRALLAALLAGVLLAEQFAAPYPAEPVNAPAFYQQLARSDEPGAILELPFSRLEPRALYFQTVHRRPLVGGYLSRDLDYPLLDLPPFRELAGRRPGPDITPPDEPGLEGRALAFAGVRWIVVRLDLATPDRPVLAQFLARWAEPEPIARDDRLVVYRARQPDPRAAPLALRPADGWYEPEPYAGGRGRMRWLRRTGALDCWNFGEESRTVALRFEAWSLNGTRRLEVAVDGRAVGQWAVDGPQRFDIPVALGPGQHRIELRTLDPATRPSDIGLGADTRPLAFGVANVELHR